MSESKTGKIRYLGVRAKPREQKVGLEDASFVRAVGHEVTDEMRQYYFDRFKRPMPKGLQVLVARDQSGRIILRPTPVTIVMAGAHLKQALKRAERWLKSPKVGDTPPRHIAYALKALAGKNPKRFEQLVAAHDS
jgi:hypothetical protein